MLSSKNTNIQTRKKIIFTALLLIALSAALYFSAGDNWKLFGGGENSDQQPTGAINYSPPTEQEANAGNEQKDIISEKEKQQKSASGSSSLKTAQLLITDAGQYDSVIEVRSFITNHYEDGVCSITFTKNNLKVSKNTPAYKDISTTICTNPEFLVTEFSEKGIWKLEVSYTSASGTTSGKSELKEVEIR